MNSFVSVQCVVGHAFLSVVLTESPSESLVDSLFQDFRGRRRAMFIIETELNGTYYPTIEAPYRVGLPYTPQSRVARSTLV